MTIIIRFFIVLVFAYHISTDVFGQIDSSLVYNPSTPFGPLDIRIANSNSEYYYLQEGVTFSYREDSGVRTNSFLDMTAWNSNAYEQGNMRLSTASGQSKFVMNYRYIKPNNYDSKLESGYPLVLVLHGLSEAANCAGNKCYHGTRLYDPNTNIPKASPDGNDPLLNNDYNLVHGGKNYLEAHYSAQSFLPDDTSLPSDAFPGFVIFPQNLNGWDEKAAEDAIRLIRLIMKKYNIDHNRIYINGISNGGRGAYEVLKRAPWLFAAGAFFSAMDDASLTTQKLESRIADIPLWVFQGEIDELVNKKDTERYVKRFRDVGTEVRYTLYKNIGHGTWNKAFAEPDFFTWILSHRKNNIHAFGGKSVLCSTNPNGTILTMPDGFPDYEWELNGQIITGENHRELSARVSGRYRGRFKISDQGVGKWNDWSAPLNLAEKILESAQIKQSGTVVLNDPNGGNQAVLEAEGNHAHYYWFRNGVRIELPGQSDDTFKIIRPTPSFGQGAYTLRVSDFDDCISPPSTEKFLFFSDKAPVIIRHPENVQASVISPSEVSVSWRDMSDNESGFEVWRRKTTAPDLIWEMPMLTDVDVTTYTDRNLSPSSSYEYMVRAVSQTGRSNYSSKTVADTNDDNIAPSAPEGLSARITSATQLLLTWNSSHDNSSLSEYMILAGNDSIYTGAVDTSYVLKNFQINKEYTFYVKAIDVASNVSPSSNGATIYTRVAGLFYEHSTGQWNSLDEINWNIAEFTGVVDSFSLAPKTQEDFFNFRFTGYLNFEKGGVYQFRLSSNDGSRLSLDDSVFIVNDGIHNVATVTSPVHVFSGGPHQIQVEFFDNVLADTLNVEYKGPDTKNQWISIPSDKLVSGNVPLDEDELSGKLKFEMYPNPLSNDPLRCIFFTLSTEPIIVSILSSTGEELQLHTVNSSRSSTAERYVINLDLNTLANGVYFIKARQQSGYSLVKRLVILK